ncbi:MAG: hypothetical protein ACE5EQ_05085 [Phycisphaerae bacterium]
MAGLVFGCLSIAGLACGDGAFSTKSEAKSDEPSKTESTAKKPAEQQNVTARSPQQASPPIKTAQATPKNPAPPTRATPTVEKASVKKSLPRPKPKLEAIMPKTIQPPPDSIESQKAQMADEIYATIRVSMEIAIEQRKEFLSAGKSPTDGEIQRLETTIRNARRLLIEHGENVDEVVPPLPG